MWYTVGGTVGGTQWAVHSGRYTVGGTHGAVHSGRHTRGGTQWEVHSVWCTVCGTQWEVHSAVIQAVHRTVHTMQCTVPSYCSDHGTTLCSHNALHYAVVFFSTLCSHIAVHDILNTCMHRHISTFWLITCKRHASAQRAATRTPCGLPDAQHVSAQLSVPEANTTVHGVGYMTWAI